MVRFDTTKLQKAVEATGDAKWRVAAHTGTSPVTMTKVLSGDADVSLASIEKVAGHFGFDLELRLVAKKKERAVV